jgi:hypothetical protein
MEDEMLSEVNDLKDQFLQLKPGSLSAEELREVYNGLTAINLAVEGMLLAKDMVFQNTQKIRQILHSHDENTSTTKEQNS